MPVSKRRKPKKQRKKAVKHPAADRVEVGSRPRVIGSFSLFNPRPLHEPWFAEETEAILAESERDWLDWYDGSEFEDLEARAGNRVGEVMLRRGESDLSSGNSFVPWFAHLAKAASMRSLKLREEGEESWLGPACLLFGLSGIAPSSVGKQTAAAVGRVRKALDRDGWPPGLDLTLNERTETTGRAWTAQDAYGDQFAVVVETSGEDLEEPRLLLVSVEMGANNVATYAAQAADPEQALAFWRRHVGASAGDAELRPVAGGEDLWFLAYLTDPADIAWELHKRPIYSHYFEAQRRLEDLVAHLERRGAPVPAALDLFATDVEPDFEPFMDYLMEQHPEIDENEAGGTAFAVIQEWLTDTAPPTRYSASPRRVRSRSLLLFDLNQEVPYFKEVTASWVRYCAERAGLDERWTEAAVAAVPSSRDEAMRFETGFEPPADSG
ncbi:hypothetical protein LO763_01805 [Glycomyces sp. A-F 0318]|uniref:hypothetical protein n=1 Tax=Glycomyces amatae TaxID=2881355 RepID=UPI001E555E2D|nr:hypothetical protein [Glycomyces amatae]MCD0442361.1 hypothetical protein [Glycomyces amatae]